MKKLLSGICATALAAAVTVTGLAPAMAAPAFMPQPVQVKSDVIDVQHRRKSFRRSGNSAWYNGHRGYRHPRRGYRQYNGFWFPAGAFLAGALISGAIANSNQRGYGNAHVEWCYNRYRSYRAYDNTFQPYNGPRRICYSPYD